MVVAGKQFCRCAITGLNTSDADTRRAQLETQVRQWASGGIDIIQLREKQLDAGELFDLARLALEVLHASAARTKLIINGRADVAAAAGADGVHLTAHPGELTPSQVRRIFTAADHTHCLVTASCHTLAEVERARSNGAGLILFGPVFEKRVGHDLIAAGTGLNLLRASCAAAGDTPVLALGGITEENAAACLHAGAAGIAGIRLFHQAPSR